MSFQQNQLFLLVYVSLLSIFITFQACLLEIFLKNSNLLHLFHKNSLKPWKPDNFRSKFPQKSPITHTATTSNWAPSPPYVTHRSKQRTVTEIPKSKNYFLKKIPSIQNVPGSCNRWHRMRQDQSLWSIPKVLRRASRQCRCHIQRK